MTAPSRFTTRFLIMVPKERSIISREETDIQNIHKPELLKSRSNDRCRKSYKRHIREMGRVNRPRIKTFKEEDDEFADTLIKAELLDHDNCMWLSSDGASSPTSCSQDDGLFGFMDLKIDAWFISLLSTTPSSSKSAAFLSTEATFFDGSRVNPIEEASLVLDQRIIPEEKDMVFQENLEEEEVISWLDEDAESSYYSQSSVKDSTELHKFYFLLSKWTSNKTSESLSELSTPVTKSYQLSTSSFSSVTDSSDNHSIFSSSSSSDHSSEVVDLDEIGIDKPLFWPSEWESDWSSETKCDFFEMSPRKNIHKTRNSPKTTYHPKLPNAELNSERSCKGKLVFSTRSKSSANSDLKQTNGVNDIKMDSDTKWDFFVMSPRKDIYKVGKSPNTSPDAAFKLRVHNGKTNSEKSCTRRLDFSTGSNEAAAVGDEVGTAILTTKSVGKHKIVLEDLLLVEKLSIEGAIEDVLGLKEFDGHEGIDSKFKNDGFSFVEI